MTPEEFIEKADRTNSHKFYPPTDPKIIQLLHAVVGLSTESGEALDAFNRAMFYGKELDIINVKEELADKFWYLACACKAMNWTFDELQTMAINKLAIRYPEKFTIEAAYQRDLVAERELLEKEFSTTVCLKCGMAGGKHSSNCPIGGA